jgi:hypothetical protein
MGGTGLMRRTGPFGEYAPKRGATLLNDVTFENYHQFRSDSRILIGNIPVPTQ